jgi:hypothetical protein
VTPVSSSLAEVSTSALERLREAIARGAVETPLTRSTLIGFGIQHQLDGLTAALSGHSRLACLAILDVTLAERAKHNLPSPELVWTGPEGHGATARDTSVVLRSLFESAREHVILAGYSFTHAENVLAPLHDVMQTHGVRATLFVDVTQPKVATDPPERHAEVALAGFMNENWAFGPPYPALYYDRRAIVPPPPYSILHAKCVVVDGARAFRLERELHDAGPRAEHRGRSPAARSALRGAPRAAMAVAHRRGVGGTARVVPRGFR